MDNSDYPTPFATVNNVPASQASEERPWWYPRASNASEARFHAQYVTSQEIRRRLGVTRTTISIFWRSGKLPTPIVLGDGGFLLWERAVVEPVLAEWEDTRRRLGRLPSGPGNDVK